MLNNIRGIGVILAVVLAIGCQETPYPSEPVIDPNLSIQSSSSEVMWQDNKLEYQVDGDNYRIEVDKPLATEAEFYRNGTLRYRVEINRSGEKITSVRVKSASGAYWFEGNSSGSLTKTSADGDGGGSGDPCRDGCPESPAPTADILSANDDCDGSRNAFIGAGLAAIGGGAASFLSGLIGGLFPVSAPVAGPAAVATADFAFVAAGAAIVSFSVYVICVGGECTTDCVPQSVGLPDQRMIALGSVNTCNV